MRGSAALVLAMLAGCILVVKPDPSSFGAHCRFDGDDSTTCGQCVAAECSAQVDACCDPASSCALLDALDACSSDTASSSCDALVPSANQNATEGALAQCIAKSCPACAKGSPKTNHCSTSLDSCTCEADESGDGKPCDINVIANAVCCADFGFPNAGTRCDCNRSGCQVMVYGDGSSACECMASATASGPLASCGHEQGLHCCTELYGCRCSDDACSASETEVDECGPAAIGCGPSSGHVSSCTF